MRLDKYTPQAANEVREWIESVLGERLGSGDLLDALKDGVALCKCVPPFSQLQSPSHALTQLPQTRQPRPPAARHQVQALSHAIRTDGERIALLARLPIPASQPATPRCLPHCRSVRAQGPRASPAMPGRFQQSGESGAAVEVSNCDRTEIETWNHESAGYGHSDCWRRELRE